MDAAETWIQIILEWANHTGFMNRTFYALHKTDINSFYGRFRQRISTVDIKQIGLLKFLEDYYPDYKPDLDFGGKLQTAGYIHIYTLLLHFACVRCPQTDLQNLCGGLSERSQIRIAAFFTALMEHSRISANVLQAAIEESYTSSGKADLLSPTKSKCMSNAAGVATHSPPTPRTKLMDDWNYENRQLKALIETERYERSFLEVQMKQLEEKNAELCAERKRHMIQTNELKNKLLVKNTENESPNRNMQDEQIKQRLRKQIASKEDEIGQLSATIDAMRDENVSLRQKHKLAEQKIQHLDDQSFELTETLSRLRDEFDVKAQHLSNMETINRDLQLHIRDNCNSCHPHSRLDMSVECDPTSPLDISNGSRQSSPETLGRTVIDMQLREQQTLNQKLTEKLANAEAANVRLSQQQSTELVKLQQALTEVQRDRNELQSMCSKLQAEEIERKRQLDVHLKELETQRRTHSQQLSEHLLGVRKIEEKCEGLAKENRFLLGSCEKLQSKFSTECDAHAGHRSESLEEVTRMQKLVDDLQTDLSNERNVCATLTRTVEELHQRLCESDERCNTAEQAQIESQHKIVDKELELQNAQQLLADHIERSRLERVALERHEEKLQMLAEQKSAASCELTSKNVEINDLKEQLCAAMTQNREHAVQNRCSMDKIAELVTKLHEAEQLRTQTISDLENTIAEKNLNSDALVSANVNAVAAEKETIRKLNEQKSVHCNEITAKDLTIEDLRTQLHAAQMFVMESETKLQTSNMKVSVIEAKLLVAEKILNDTIQENAEKISEIKNSHEIIVSDHMNDLAVNQEKLQSLMKERSRDKNFIAEISLVIDQLKTKLHASETQTQHYESKLCFASAEIEKLNSQLLASEQLQKEYTQVSATLEQCRIDLSEKANALFTMSEQLDIAKITAAARQCEIEKERNDITTKLVAAQERTAVLEMEKSKLEDENSNALRQTDALHLQVLDLTTALSENNKTIDEVKRTQQILTLLNDSLRDHLQQNAIDTKPDDPREQPTDDMTNFADKIVAQMNTLLLTKDNALLEHKNAIAHLNSMKGVAQQYAEQSIDLEAMRSQVQHLELEIQQERTKHQMAIARVEQLQGKCDVPEHLSQIQELETKCESFERENRILLESCDKLRDEMTAECVRLMGLAETERQKQTLLNDVVATLSKELDTRNANISTLTGAVEAHRMRVNDAEKKCNELERIQGETETEMAGIKTKLHDTEALMAATILDNTSKVESLASHHATELTALEEKLKKLANEQTRICTENIQKNFTIDKLRAQLDAEEAQSCELKSNLLRCTEQMIELKIIVSANIQLQDEYATVSAALEMCRAELLETVTSLDTCKKEAALAAASHASELAALNANVDCLQKAAQETNDELNAMHHLKSEHKQVICVNQSQAKNLTNFQQKIDQILLEKRELEEQVSKLNSHVADVTDQLTAVRTSNAELSIERDELAQQIELAHAELKTVQLDSSVKLKALQDECEKLTKTCKVMHQKNTELIEDNRELQAKDRVASTEKSMSSEKMAGFLERIQSLEQEKDELARDVLVAMKHRTHVEELQLQLADIAGEQADHAHLQETYATMQSSLSELIESLYAAQLESTLKPELTEAASDQNPIQTIAQLIDRLRRNHDEELVTYKNDAADMKQQLQLLSAVQEDNVQLNHSCAAVTACLERLNDDYAELKVANARYDEQTDEMVKLQLQLERLQLENGNIDKERQTLIDENQSLSARLQAQHDAVQRASEKWKAKFEALSVENCDNQKSVAILSAKLMKNRELTEQMSGEWQAERVRLQQNVKVAEARVTETRMELEGKLEKMKDKMKELYINEKGKMKEKHESELCSQIQLYEDERFKFKSEKHQLNKKLDNYEEHNNKLASQIFQLNEAALDMKKENEFMKSKLRMIESNPHALRSRIPPSSSMSSIVPMEDEVGEMFNNMNLEDLKNGRWCKSPVRPSIGLSELKYRNSLVLPHMRSSYLPQYADQNYSEDDIKICAPLDTRPHNDDSMVSVKSSGSGEVRRGTLYQKPGPPTPSKKGGRLSVGGTATADMQSYRETLKETIATTNNNNYLNNPSGTAKAGVGKKTGSTPSAKLRSLLTSSKCKDETSWPWDERSAADTETPIVNREFMSRRAECQTSTPRRKSRRFREMLLKSKRCNFEIATAATVENNAVDDLNRSSPNQSRCKANAPLNLVVAQVLSSSASDVIGKQPASRCVNRKRRQRLDRRCSTAGKRRKSILNKSNAQSELRLALRLKTKQQRTERFFGHRPSPCDSDQSTECQKSDGELQAQHFGATNSEAIRFEDLICDKFSEHPYDFDESIELCAPLTSSPPHVPLSTTDASNSFQSTKTMYSTVRLRKIPHIRQDKTIISRSDSLPLIQIADILTWNRLSKSLKLFLIILVGTVFFICIYVAPFFSSRTLKK